MSHPTTIFLAVHKGASTFLADELAPAMVRTFPGLEHLPIHQLIYQGRSLEDLKLPPTGTVVTRLYPDHYESVVEDPVPAGGRFADKKLIMLRRDPRDAAVSLYYSIRYSHQEPPAESGARERFLRCKARLETLTVAEGIRQVTAHSAITEFMATVEFLPRHPHTCLTTYESLVGDFPGWLARVQEHLGWTDEQAGAVGEGLEQSVQPPETEDPQQHKRRIRPGNWREVYDEPLCRLFRDRLGNHLTDAGYTW